MKCPHCGDDATGVLDTRPTEAGSIRRRRICENCYGRFTTHEVIAPANTSLLSPRGLVQSFDADSFLGLINGALREALTAALGRFSEAESRSDPPIQIRRRAS